MPAVPVIDRLEPRTLMAAYQQDDTFGTDFGPDLPYQTVNGSNDGFLDGTGITRTVKPLFDDQGRLTVINREGSRDAIFLVARRFLANGSLDTTLDGDGVLRIATTPGREPQAAVLNDGSLVIALNKPGEPLLRKYSAAGVRDEEFSRSLGKSYKQLLPRTSPIDDSGYVERGALSVDDDGRIVYSQATAYQATRGSARLEFRVLRFAADGQPDDSFGRSGGLDVSQTIDAPFEIDVKGRPLHNVRGGSILDVNSPSVEGGRVTVTGTLDYARGSLPYPALLSLPVLLEYDDDGRLLRKFQSSIDPAKAKWSGQSLAYSGLNFTPGSLARDGDGLIYLSTYRATSTADDDGKALGIAVFEARKGTFALRAADPTFGVIGPLYAVDGDVLATQRRLAFASRNADDRRLIRVNADATGGEVIATFPGTAGGRTLTFAKSAGRWPARIYSSGVIDVSDANALKSRLTILAADLVDQTGSVVRTGNTVEVTGTNAGDYITVVQRKRDGRYIITGAGATRSFAAGSVSRLVIRAGAGDDRIEYAPGVFNVTATIDAGSGDDVIITSVVEYAGNGPYVGTAADTIAGGSGLDVLLRDDKDTASGVEDIRDSFIE